MTVLAPHLVNPFEMCFFVVQKGNRFIYVSVQGAWVQQYVHTARTGVYYTMYLFSLFGRLEQRIDLKRVILLKKIIYSTPTNNFFYKSGAEQIGIVLKHSNTIVNLTNRIQDFP